MYELYSIPVYFYSEILPDPVEGGFVDEAGLTVRGNNSLLPLLPLLLTGSGCSWAAALCPAASTKIV